MDQNVKKDLSFESINKDIKAVLDELSDIVSVRHDNLNPAEIARNNEMFLALLDQLNMLQPLLNTQSSTDAKEDSVDLTNVILI